MFRIMDSLFAVGDSYMAELEQARAAEKRKATSRRSSDKQAGALSGKRVKGLRETDPWQ